MSKSKKSVPQNTKLGQWVVYVVSIGLVLGFFITLTALMTMTGEDILHQNSTMQSGFIATVERVYGFLPRFGEFLQRLSIQFYNYQGGLSNVDAVWRLADAIMCFMLIYVVSMLCIGRRLGPKLKDSLVLLLVFGLFITSQHSEVFMMRFSYLHNYIPILMAIALTAYYMLIHEWDKGSKMPLVLGALVGLLLGTSNEITPIAFLIMVTGYITYQITIRKTKIRGLLSKAPVKTTLVVGAVIGLAFMLSSGAITSRGDSAYGEVYDYVSIFGLLSETGYTTAKLLSHFIFNARYLFLPIFAMIVIFMGEVYLSKTQKGSRRFINIQFSALIFIFLYMLASSQINVLDDLYPRFMSPVFLMMVVSFVSFLVHLIDLLKLKQWQLGLSLITPAVIALMALTDVFYGFGTINQVYSDRLNRVRSSASAQVCVDKYEFEQQPKTPIFKFTQFSPFEEWTQDFGSAKIYGKDIDYSGDCKDLVID